MWFAKKNFNSPGCNFECGNAAAIRHKTDELEAWVKWKPGIKDTSLLNLTETWLGEWDWDKNLNISRFGCPIRRNRDLGIMRKSCEGGVCLYINKRYCNTVVIRERICTPDIELLTVSLRPFY